MTLRRWIGGRRRAEQDLEDELAAHFRMAAQDRMERGALPGEARESALREFGNVGLVKETTRAMWGWTRLDSFAADVRYALRVLAKSPAWALAVTVSFALGIGANAAIFSLTYAVILKTLPVPDPGRLIRYTFRNGDQDLGLSGPAFEALRRHQTVATDLLAWAGSDLAIDHRGAIEQVRGAMMSGDGFRVLEVEPAIGRAFTAADDAPGGGPGGYKALLGYGYWRAHYGESADVLGRQLVIGGRPVTVIGVLPQGFEGVIAGVHADILLPLAFEDVLNPGQNVLKMPGMLFLTVMGRLKAGESLQSARANLAAVAKLVRDEADPSHTILNGFFAPFRLAVVDGSGGRSFLRSTYGQPLLVLEILVAALLLLCCANTALLVFAHVSGRAREFALRSALGAGRGRLVRQVLLEVCLLAIPGLAAAVAIAWGLAHALVAMLSTSGPEQLLDVAPNATTMLFTIGITMLSAIAAGMWPALRVSRIAPAADLGGREQSGIARRTAGWIVPAQVAASATLVTAALLLGSTLVHLYTEPSGFHARQTVFADVDLGLAKLPRQRLGPAIQQMLDRLAGAPGIDAATAMSMPPLHDWWSASAYLAIDGRGNIHTDEQTWEEAVSPGYFNVMGTPILAGRAFEPADGNDGCLVVIGASEARRFFAGDNPVGRAVYAGTGDPKIDGGRITSKNSCRVIGVAADARFRSLREAPPRMLYKLTKPADFGAQFTLAVRSTSAAVAVRALHEAVVAGVPAADVTRAYTMSQLIASHLTRERILIALSGSFAAIALVLTAFGLFGLLMRGVIERRREIGIRMALGARRPAVVFAIVRRAARQMLVGLVIGTVVAAASTRALQSLLFGTSAADPRVYVTTVVVILLVGGLAALIPARRAASVDPMQALRTE
jgi:putative ABC transport system permease protein